MQYILIKKMTVNGEVKNYNATKDTLEEARKSFHAQLAAAYGTEGLTHLMCMVINDSCGVEMQECYYRTATSSETVETTEETTTE